MTEKKRALITGISGQTGSYLAEFLLAKGYQVFGMVRKDVERNFSNIKHIEKELILLNGDLTDYYSLTKTLEESRPDELYNLGAQSFVPLSWEQPEFTANVNGLGVLRLLEAARRFNPKIKFYQASTSEMFGNSPAPQNEDTPFRPRSPYGIAKLYAHWIVRNYRESYGMFAVSGICFNHESPRRGEEFVTRKISKAAARGLPIELGNLSAQRDWGFAGDYVEAMWLMLQAEIPKDYVIATGKTHPVREFLEKAYKVVGKNYMNFYKLNPKFIRPAEVNVLCGDASLIKKDLGWKPKTSFDELVKMMVEADIKNNG